MRLSFDTIEEILDFVDKLKKTRTKKGEADEAGSAPQPLQPPAGGQAQAFNPGGFGAGATMQPAAGAFPAGPSPEVVMLVQRINSKIDGALASGQPADQALAWFRGQCGPGAEQATMDQIKTIFLPRMSKEGLELIAKFMNA